MVVQQLPERVQVEIGDIDPLRMSLLCVDDIQRVGHAELCALSSIGVKDAAGSGNLLHGVAPSRLGHGVPAALQEIGGHARLRRIVVPRQFVQGCLSRRTLTGVERVGGGWQRYGGVGLQRHDHVLYIAVVSRLHQSCTRLAATVSWPFAHWF